ncbi:Coiled-coil domain-containing protein [Elsinoe fawcettii]|nr:Coiled-coil domain-containing protein [Elsinoe fawcettii]
MSLSFGLNVKSQPSTSAPPKKKPQSTIFDSDSEPDTAPPPPSRSKPSRPSKPTQPPSLSSRPRRPSQDFIDLASSRLSAQAQAEAESLDPSIYDYDTFHASKSAVDAQRAALQKQDALERKPKYINNLLSVAAQRKQDQAIAKEKALQREREAEGDAFADKETFVTDAYKKQREENRKVEEEEARKVEEEERKRGKGLGAFYRGVLGEQERVFEERREAAEKAIREGVRAEEQQGARDEVEEARRRGVEVLVNEDGEVADKRQLLSAGLNVGAGNQGSEGAEHLRSDRGKRENAFKPVHRGDARGQRERQTRMMEEQLAASAKRKADEEAEERRKLEHAAKSKKTEGDVMSAKERYLARKKEREEAAKKGG